MALLLLVVLFILARLRCLLAEGIVRLLWRRRSFRLNASLAVSSELVVGLVGLRALRLRWLRAKRRRRGLLRWLGQTRWLLGSRYRLLSLRLRGWGRLTGRGGESSPWLGYWRVLGRLSSGLRLLPLFVNI